jgi:putative hydrolase of the HAD superfamily
MIDIKGIIFDYGGTIDSNGLHWADVLWEQYEQLEIPISKEDFKEAYVHGERTLAKKPIVKPEFNFFDVLLAKVNLQIEYLVGMGKLNKQFLNSVPQKIAHSCYNFAAQCVNNAKPTIQKLHNKYPLVLVSNFYGNINSVLTDFDIKSYFMEIIESAVVGVRKPNPEIFTLGVNALKLPPEQVVVIGDSFSKDIVPAGKAGCKTIWLKNGEGWDKETDDSLATEIINDFTQIGSLILP